MHSFDDDVLHIYLYCLVLREDSCDRENGDYEILSFLWDTRTRNVYTLLYSIFFYNGKAHNLLQPQVAIEDLLQKVAEELNNMVPKSTVSTKSFEYLLCKSNVIVPISLSNSWLFVNILTPIYWWYTLTLWNYKSRIAIPIIVTKMHDTKMLNTLWKFEYWNTHSGVSQSSLPFVDHFKFTLWKSLKQIRELKILLLYAYNEISILYTGC